MRAFIAKFIQDAKSSYWLIPGCFIFFSFMLAINVIMLDRIIPWSWLEQLKSFVKLNAKESRDVITLIASAIIGLTGVSFSVAMLAVSFASANFGPRLISNFMKDRTNQICLGIFLGTFVYCLTVIAIVQSPFDGGANGGKPAYDYQLSVLGSYVFTFVSIVALVRFIHHVPESLNISNLVARIGTDLLHQIEEATPITKNYDFEDKTNFASKRCKHKKDICADGNGYLQQIKIKKILENAKKNDWVIVVHFAVGEFIIDKDVLYTVWSKRGVNESECRKLLDFIVIGNERTEYQNINFMASKLVEIIARALSPGINDPMTAVNCINWLKLALIRFLHLYPVSGECEDNHNRLSVKTVSFTDFASSIFDRILQYVTQDLTVTIHMISVFEDMIKITNCKESKAFIQHHMDRFYKAALENMDQPILQKDIKAAYKRATD